MRQPLDSLYITYWSLRDPLCQSQSLPYLRGLTAEGTRIGLVTFEQDPWRRSSEENAAMAASLRAEGIHWRGLTYHRRPPILATAFDMARGAAFARRWARNSNATLLHGRSLVAGAIAWAGGTGTTRRFFYDADGPLADEYAEAGAWRPGSWVHRAVRAADRALFRAADRTAVLTDHRSREVEHLTSSRPLVLPCAVDTTHFQPQPEAGAELRTQLGLNGTVFVYAGKAGGHYLTETLFDFVAAYRDAGNDVSMLVLTTQPAEPFERVADKRGLSAHITRASREEMPAFLSAADVGLCFVKPTPSKRACSPIKLGEYLACGLPVVTNSGLGDYPRWVKERGLGVVVEDLEPAPPAFRSEVDRLRALLETPDLAETCRRAAVELVGLEEVLVPRYAALYRALLA